MESTINVRISSLIKFLRMSNNAFAKSIGRTSSAINQIVDGRSKPGFEILEAICSIYPVNTLWLMRGEGEMMQELNSTSENRSDQYLQDHVKHLEESFAKLAHQLEVKDKQMDGMQRTIDYLLGKHEGVINLAGRIVKLYPAMDLQA